jgi:flagellar basal body-associated protein FliL
MMGGIIAGILIIIVMLALIGLGWYTFVSGVKKGADKAGITPIVQGAVEIVENGTRNIVSNLRQ